MYGVKDDSPELPMQGSQVQLVTYNKTAVSNDVVETGCLENFFTRLSVWFLFPDLVRPPPQEVKIASSVGGRLII